MVDLQIIQRVAECDDQLHRMRRESPEGITLHMFGVPGVHDMAGIARFYRGHPEWTGGQMPYTYGVLAGGFVEQGLPLNEVGPHAKRWNSSTIGVVSLGDFNRHAPTSAQWHSCLDLCAELCVAFRLDPRSKTDVAGHTERPHSTNTPGKVCPGRFWDMAKFRLELDRIVRNAAIQRLEWARVAV